MYFLMLVVDDDFFYKKQLVGAECGPDTNQ
jgi:hypothetical protein